MFNMLRKRKRPYLVSLLQPRSAWRASQQVSAGKSMVILIDTMVAENHCENTSSHLVTEVELKRQLNIDALGMFLAEKERKKAF